MELRGPVVTRIYDLAPAALRRAARRGTLDGS